MADDLDSFDRKILSIIQRDSSLPLREIGARVNLSAPAVQRRIRRMEENGVIEAQIAVLDPTRLGPSITIFAQVELEAERSHLIDAAKRRFAEAPEVQQCYYVTGDPDFVLVIVVPTMQDYDALTRRLFLDDPNIRRFTTLVAMERVKVGLTLPLE